MTREQEDLELPFQLFDALADGWPRHPQPLCCGAKAARPRDLEEDADVIPVWAGERSEFRGVLTGVPVYEGDNKLMYQKAAGA